MRKIHININDKGFTLVEMIVAMAIFVMIMMVTTQVFINSITVTSESETLSQLQVQLDQAMSKIQNAGQVADCVTTGIAIGSTDFTSGDYCGKQNVVGGVCGQTSVGDTSINSLTTGTKADIQFYQQDPYTTLFRNWSFNLNAFEVGDILYYSEYSTMTQDIVSSQDVNTQLMLNDYVLLGGALVYQDNDLDIDQTNSGFSLKCPCSNSGGTCNQNNTGIPYIVVKLSGYFLNEDSGKKVGPLTVYGSINLNNSVIW